MDALDWARWQFGITTVYHFLFVPLTLGLSLFVAVLQTRWQRTGQDRYLRLTRLFGRILVINFALGVATGLVQEFQFGMNWSSYSRFVGDVFGSLLAVEGLLAFFLESTFLGLWVFGWGRLPPRLHLATIWLVAAGTTASAYFILAANSFMQHPVGYRLNAATGRAELTDFGALITNQALLGAFPHVISSAWLTTSCLVLAVCVWHLWRAKDDPAAYDQSDVDTYLTGARLAAWVAVLVGLVSFISGDFQAKLMTEQQPMKMAAAEGLYETSQPASLSVVTIGSLDGSE